MARRIPKVTGCISVRPGSKEDRETGTRSPSRVPESMTHRPIRVFGRWESVAEIPATESGLRFDPHSVLPDPLDWACDAQAQEFEYSRYIRQNTVLSERK